VDDTRHSRAAAAFLRTRVLTEETTVTILSSAESPVTELAARHLSEPQLRELSKPALDRATALVQRLRDDFIKEGYSVVTAVKMNHVIETIVKHLESEQPDLLVIGSRSLTRAERLHLGSVSDTLLKYAPCSVLIVRGARA
jgi:nucleotide-binding universal stress UspA family protein